MKSWGLYFLVLGLTLSAMAAVSLHLLYSWKVAPVLAVNKATQARHHKVFEDDLEYLSHFEVFEALAPMKNPNRDAGTLLNAKFSWTPSPQGQLSHVDPELAERLIRMGTDWITLAAKQKTNAKYNFPV
ncbi:MAG TPA: hypothetical protein VM432_09435, partial [Bdellovibrionales bacterium]|nr:hypothetical protein [Bdellovibrionales bacterium]